MLPKYIATIIATVFAAFPAWSLSCLPPDVARSYKQADEADELYVIAKGALHFDESQLPVVDLENQQNTPKSTKIPARLSGALLSLSGFDVSFDHDITLDVQCFGPWCGGASTGAEYLVFLEKANIGYLLSLDPCGGLGFPAPTEMMLEKVLQCAQGGSCEPEF